MNLLEDSGTGLSAGIVAADLLNLRHDVQELEKLGPGGCIRALHFDVMDGCFTPAMTLGVPFVKAVRTSLLKDVHLMIEDPLEKVEDYVGAGADMVTIHYESCTDPGAVLERLTRLENVNDAARGIVRGLALNPTTPVSVLEPLLPQVDMVVVLAVDPTVRGGGGVDLEQAAGRVGQVRQLLAGSERRRLISVDGGVKHQNVNRFSAMEPDLIVSGSALFAGGAIPENVQRMAELL